MAKIGLESRQVTTTELLHIHPLTFQNVGSVMVGPFQAVPDTQPCLPNVPSGRLEDILLPLLTPGNKFRGGRILSKVFSPLIEAFLTRAPPPHLPTIPHSVTPIGAVGLRNDRGGDDTDGSFPSLVDPVVTF